MKNAATGGKHLSSPNEALTKAASGGGFNDFTSHTRCPGDFDWIASIFWSDALPDTTNDSFCGSLVVTSRTLYPLSHGCSGGGFDENVKDFLIARRKHLRKNHSDDLGS